MSGHDRQPVVVVVSVVAVGRTRPVTGTPATGRPSQDDMCVVVSVWFLGGVVTALLDTACLICWLLWFNGLAPLLKGTRP